MNFKVVGLCLFFLRKHMKWWMIHQLILLCLGVLVIKASLCGTLLSLPEICSQSILSTTTSLASLGSSIHMGEPQHMKSIHRQKPVHSHFMQNLQVQGQGNSSLSEAERKSMKDEIEKLNCEKECLVVELQRHEQERQGMEMQMQFLHDRLQHMQRQRQTMVSVVARALQKPELASNPVPELTT